MKVYTGDDCINDEYNDDGSRSFYFQCEDDPDYKYEIRVSGITLSLTEEIEKNGGGECSIFAAEALNREWDRIEGEQNIRDFLEEMSDDV